MSTSKSKTSRAGVAELGLAGRRFFSEKFAAELGYNLGFYTVTLEKGTADNAFLNRPYFTLYPLPSRHALIPFLNASIFPAASPWAPATACC